MFVRVPFGAVLLVSAVLVLAALLVVHVALVGRVLTSAKTSKRERLASLVPLLTPVIAWRVARRAVVAWGVLLALYLVLRVVLAMR